MSYSVAVLAGAFTFAYVLGPSEYGRLGVLVACGSLAITLSTQGVRMFYLREAAGKETDDPGLPFANFVAIVYCVGAGVALWIVGHWFEAATLLGLYGLVVALVEYLLDRWRALQMHRNFLLGTALRALSYACAVIFVGTWREAEHRSEDVFALLVVVVLPTIWLAVRRDSGAFAIKSSLSDLVRASRFGLPIALTYAAYYLIITLDRFVFISTGQSVEAGIITFHTELFVIGSMAVLLALQLPLGPRVMAAVRKGGDPGELALNRRILGTGGALVLVCGALAFEALASLEAFDERYFHPGLLGTCLALGTSIIFAFCFYHLYLIQAALGSANLQLISMCVALISKALFIWLMLESYQLVEAIGTTFAAALAALGTAVALMRKAVGEDSEAVALAPVGGDVSWPIRPRTGDRVSLLGDRVEKRVVGSVSEAALRHEVLWRISSESGLYEAPRLLSVAAESSTLVLSRLKLGESLRASYVRALSRSRSTPDVQFCGLIRELARVLARIHSDAHRTASEALFYHGDFGFSNVFVTKDPSARLQILDPIPTPESSSLPKHGPPAHVYDVATMMGCLYGRVPPARVGLLLGSQRVRGFYGALFFSEYARSAGSMSFSEAVLLARSVFTRYCQSQYGDVVGRVAAAFMFHGINVK